MKQGGIKATIGSALVGIFLTGISFTVTSLEMDEEPTVKVSAFARHVGNRIKYHYRVENETEQSVIAISIGRDNRGDDDPINDILELNSRPSGWDARFGLPSSSYRSPNGWRASMTTYNEEEETEQTEIEQAETEEPLPYAITWKPLNERSTKLLAGRYSTKFSITVDEADVNFLTGHALIVLEENEENIEGQASDQNEEVQVTTLSVPIELIDLTPPSLEVTLMPNEIPYTDDGMPVAIRTTVKTTDDFDSMPRIKLEAISTDESSDGAEILDASFGLDDRYFKLPTDPEAETDQTYVIYYSATDAAWNQTLTSSTVTVFGAHTDEVLEIQTESPDGMSPEGILMMPPVIKSVPLGMFR
ncbi:MAG: hypothetical protein R8M11_02075 [Gallionella sp.]